MKLVVFDICGTIYDSNTSFDFLENYIVTQNFNNQLKYRILKSIPVRVLNKILIRSFNYDLIKILATKMLSNLSTEFIELQSKEFVKNYLHGKEREYVTKLLDKYRKENWQIVLISGAYEFIVKEIAQFHDVNNFFASTLEVKEGKYTGIYSNDIIEIKKDIFQQNFEDIDELVVVTDNKTDLELLKLANFKYIVTDEKNLNFWKRQEFEDVEYIKVGQVR
jgi:HAD superfamily phosphoserine phosphatase-like hydrolase